MKKRKNPLFLLVSALLILAAVLRFYHIDAQSLWSDEGNSVAMAPRASLEIIQRTANDIHPPLYYLTLHGWSAFTGTSVVAVRALSALFGLITVALTGALGLRIGGWRVALFATLAAALSPFAIHYSQEARMYIMVTMLGAASWLAFSRSIVTYWLLVPPAREKLHSRSEQSRYHLGLFSYFFITLALIYTHYYAVSVVVAQNLAWLWATIRARRWERSWWVKWIAVQAAIVALYLPWIWYARDTILNWPSISDEISLSFITRETFRIFSLGLANDGMTWWTALGFGVLLAVGMIVALRAIFILEEKEYPFGTQASGGHQSASTFSLPPSLHKQGDLCYQPSRLWYARVRAYTRSFMERQDTPPLPLSPSPPLRQAQGTALPLSPSPSLPLFYFLVPPLLMLILSLDRPFWNPKFLLLALPSTR